ncbi:hypothetical protein SDC9_09281 [bioreactor metagenome]|uniref:Uncharacterized protein n=1 Tax=bioreactor metagenome TaxID=1076179 RepID=A0A644T9Z2_9ZZZZ|nr:hypothetical protein [Desulfitobacterium hafniense]MEA5024171.1 hypothetical protein [Desulfitobacterium hafniense]
MEQLLLIIIGACLVIFVMGLKQWANDNQRQITWWKWALVALWVIVGAMSVAFITTSLGENEMKAAIRGSIFFLPLTVISGGLLWRFVLNKETGTMSKKNVSVANEN